MHILDRVINHMFSFLIKKIKNTQCNQRLLCSYGCYCAQDFFIDLKVGPSIRIVVSMVILNGTLCFCFCQMVTDVAPLYQIYK